MRGGSSVTLTTASGNSDHLLLFCSFSSQLTLQLVFKDNASTESDQGSALSAISLCAELKIQFIAAIRDLDLDPICKSVVLELSFLDVSVASIHLLLNKFSTFKNRNILQNGLLKANNETLQKAQRTRGLSSAYQCNFFTQVLTQILIRHLQNLDQEQLQNLDWTLKPCAQSMNKNLTLWPNFTFQICTKLLSARFSSSTWVTVTTSTSFELSSSHQSSLLNSSEWQAFPMIGLGSDKNVFSKKKIVMKWSEMARNLFLRISATNHGFCFDLSCKNFFLSTSFFSFFLLLLHRYSSFPPPNVFLSLKHFFFPFKI